MGIKTQQWQLLLVSLFARDSDFACHKRGQGWMSQFELIAFASASQHVWYYATRKTRNYRKQPFRYSHWYLILSPIYVLRSGILIFLNMSIVIMMRQMPDTRYWQKILILLFLWEIIKSWSSKIDGVFKHDFHYNYMFF